MFICDNVEENIFSIGDRRGMKTSNKRKVVLFGILIFLLFLLIQFIVGVAGGIVAVIPVAISTGGNFDYVELVKEVQPVILFASELVSMAVFGFWYYIKYVKRGTLTEDLRVDKEVHENPWNVKSVGFIVCSTVVTFCVALLISHFISALSPTSYDIFNSVMNTAMGDGDLIGYLTVMLAAPIAEELAYRGILLQKSKTAFGIKGCIILNALLFAAMHLNPLQSLYAIPIGMTLTYLAYRYDTVGVSILAHVLNNSISVLLPLALNRDLNNIEVVIALVLFMVPTVLLSGATRTMRVTTKEAY